MLHTVCKIAHGAQNLGEHRNTADHGIPQSDHGNAQVTQGVLPRLGEEVIGDVGHQHDAQVFRAVVHVVSQLRAQVHVADATPACRRTSGNRTFIPFCRHYRCD